MYTPPGGRDTNLERLHAFMVSHSFATLVSLSGADLSGQGALVASHLPLLTETGRGPAGQLIGHLAAANPQSEALDGQRVLAIFTGPHAYISPSWYETDDAVPTWNYVAVHAFGTVRMVRELNRLRDLVRRFVDFYEADMRTPWSLDRADPELITRLLSAIVGFTIDIERIEGARKLSQHHPASRRTSVVNGLRALGGDRREQIADLMAETMAEPSGE